MEFYKYKFLDKMGCVKIEFNFIENETQLFQYLNDIGGTLISYKKISSKIRRPIEEFTIPFFKNLYQLISNRMELIASLKITEKLFQKEEGRLIVENIIQNIKSGISFSEALSKFDRYFDKLTLKIIEISEKTANLSDSLKNIIVYLESESITKQKIKNSLRYPMILFFGVVFVMMFWILFIVPKFAELFSDIGTELPFLTKCVIKLSSFFQKNLLIILLIFATLVFFAAKLLKDKKKSEKFLNIIPIVKNIKREIVVMNFFSAMSMMMRGHVNLLDALECQGIIKNFPETKDILLYVRNGTNLTNSMRKCKIFNDYEISIIESGEKSGDLWPAFKSASEMLRMKLNQRSEKIISLIPTITIIFIGILLLVIVYSVIVPMYSNLEIGM